ncbi:type II toxin-antitoxin system VapC family toxin [Minwuia thermotolerans]|nr:PIN domain-containing protein [Minwuia thermotolerans]
MDTSVLVYLFDDQARPPRQPGSREPLAHCAARITHLVETLSTDDARIVVPTPTLAELMVREGPATGTIVEKLKRHSRVRIVGFDERAAVEFAATQAERGRGRKRGQTPRAKAKFDDQIVAIAAVEGATRIYSDDRDIRKLAEGRFEVVGMFDLPLPPQGSLPFP